MLDFQQKRKIRSIMYHRATLVALFVLMLLVLHSTWGVYRKKADSEEMKNISIKHMEELRSRSDELKTKIDRLSTNTGIEEEIRSKFSVAKPSENMVIVVDENKKVPENVASVGVWAKFKGFFNKK